jgi:hypothetical protein
MMKIGIRINAKQKNTPDRRRNASPQANVPIAAGEQARPHLYEARRCPIKNIRIPPQGPSEARSPVAARAAPVVTNAAYQAKPDAAVTAAEVLIQSVEECPPLRVLHAEPTQAS